MKISKIQVILLQKKLTSTMNISRGGFDVRTHAVVKVTTDQGITGLGEGVGDALMVKSIIDGKLGEQAIGLDPMSIESIRKKLIDSQVYFERKGSVICAASGIEMACWDIMGKALNVPVYQLLGGLYRDRLETYVSDVYWEKDPHSMSKNLERILKKEFKTIKAHVGCESPEADEKRIEALRRAAGNETNLMIDLNGGYTHREAMVASHLWDRFNLFWLEEPLNPNQVDALADFRSRSKLTIAAGENEFRLHGFKQLFDRRAVDVAMPDIGRVGGIQEARNICALAESYGIPVSPHNFSSGILLAATMHLMAATPNTWLLELDSSDNSVYEELLVSPLEISKGFLQVPNHSGLGVELTDEIIKKYSVE
ncbi:MAG: mandelate racemase/muconate lactonizing enzyme family protein [Opitutae bacterium]|nr:mandelate racemase/muconate lactonizing enzyme family protein [Opitutae bacterium]